MCSSCGEAFLPAPAAAAAAAANARVLLPALLIVVDVVVFFVAGPALPRGLGIVGVVVAAAATAAKRELGSGGSGPRRPLCRSFAKASLCSRATRVCSSTEPVQSTVDRPTDSVQHEGRKKVVHVAAERREWEDDVQAGRTGKCLGKVPARRSNAPIFC